MITADIMTKNVICVRASTPVSEIAALLLKNEISAVPVIDDLGHVVGIVSEDDLLRRRAARQSHSWWLTLLAGGRPRPYHPRKYPPLRASCHQTEESPDAD